MMLYSISVPLMWLVVAAASTTPPNSVVLNAQLRSTRHALSKPQASFQIVLAEDADDDLDQAEYPPPASPPLIPVPKPPAPHPPVNTTQPVADPADATSSTSTSTTSTSTTPSAADGEEEPSEESQRPNNVLVIMMSCIPIAGLIIGGAVYSRNRLLDEKNKSKTFGDGNGDEANSMHRMVTSDSDHEGEEEGSQQSLSVQVVSVAASPTPGDDMEMVRTLFRCILLFPF